MKKNLPFFLLQIITCLLNFCVPFHFLRKNPKSNRQISVLMNKKHTQRLSKRNPFIKDSLFIKSANYSLLSFIFGIIILFASFGFRSTALEDDHQPTIFARSIVTLERIVVKKIIASKQKIALEIDEHKSALMNVASSFTKKGGTASTPHSIIAYSTGSPNEYAISASGDTRNGAASNATGAPDGITTEVGSNSDYLVLTLANELPLSLIHI